MAYSFVGRKDAAALLGVSSAVLASLPLAAGSPAAAAALGAAAAGGGWLASRSARRRLSRVNESAREGFILPSDPTYGQLTQAEALRFGYTRDNGLPVDIANGLLQRHTAIIGQSGVGKTTIGEYLLWTQAARGGGWLFIDAKLDAETRDKLAYMARLLGREEDFYVINVDDPANSHTYNPILQGSADQIASRLLNLLPSSENNPGADYYRQAANHALTVIIAALQAGRWRYTFEDLSIAMQSASAMEAIERLVPPNCPERRALQVFLDQFRRRNKEGTQIDVNKLKEVLGGMSGRIALFGQGKFGQVFNAYAPQVDLTDIVLNNKLCYVMLPTMGADTAALNLGKMIISDLRTAVYNIQGLPKYRRPDPPFMVFADEMGSYVMKGVTTLFEQARSAGISMVPAFQSFSQLNEVSPDFSDRIIQNTWNKVFFKFGSQDSPETAAEIIGKTVKHVYSLSLSENASETSPLLRTTPQLAEGQGGGMGESWREEEAHRVTPDQLKSLGIGEAVIASGSRLFHVSTPMMLFPHVPEFRAIKHPTEVPTSERTLNFAQRYREFLLDAGENPED